MGNVVERNEMDAKLVQAYRKSLREAWPHRHTIRGRTVTRVAVARLKEARG